MRYGLGALAIALTATATLASAQDRSVDAHMRGYVPTTVPATVRIVANRTDYTDLIHAVNVDFRALSVEIIDPREGFDIYVTPNIVPEAQALALAGGQAVPFCQRAAGATQVKIIDVVRHSELNLGSWAFRAHCVR